MLADQMIEQKSLARFRRVGRERPGAASLADRVPGPDGVGIDAVHGLDLDLDRAVVADHAHPVAVGEAELRAVVVAT